MSKFLIEFYLIIWSIWAFRMKYWSLNWISTKTKINPTIVYFYWMIDISQRFETSFRKSTTHNRWKIPTKIVFNYSFYVNNSFRFLIRHSRLYKNWLKFIKIWFQINFLHSKSHEQLILWSKITLLGNSSNEDFIRIHLLIQSSFIVSIIREKTLNKTDQFLAEVNQIFYSYSYSSFQWIIFFKIILNFE